MKISFSRKELFQVQMRGICPKRFARLYPNSSRRGDDHEGECSDGMDLLNKCDITINLEDRTMAKWELRISVEYVNISH